MAHTKVSRSPVVIARSSVRDTSPTPATQSTAAMMLYRSGLIFTTAHVRKGTSTQYTAVKNAFLEGVVRARPKVCTE